MTEILVFRVIQIWVQVTYYLSDSKLFKFTKAQLPHVEITLQGYCIKYVFKVYLALVYSKCSVDLSN